MMKHKLIISAILSVVGLIHAADPLLGDLGLDSDVSKEEKSYTCVAAPPPAPPAQHSSAEGLPPLPLPVVPLRRTEKKNPPRPPVLIAKVSTQDRNDWATNPTDAQNLLKWMAKNLNVNFSDMVLPDNQIPSDPKTVPILYRTGHDAFTFTQQQKQNLRQYLFNGGTLILESCCGRRAFAESALREIRDLIPERPPYRLSNDHPLFKSYFDIKSIKYRPYALKAGAKDDRADIIGVDVGCRTAVFVFRWDVSCGWDDQPDTLRHRCLGYSIDTSKQLGANLLAYISSERSTALPLSQALEFADADKTSNDKFRIAQVKYSGLWKCREAGLSMLLNNFHEQTKVPVLFERDEVALTSPHLFDLPFVYMTGHQDFQLTDAEREALAKYIRLGGVVFAESCCGRDTFSKAFRREIARAMDGAKLERIPINHPIFAYPNNIKNIQPLPALAEKLQTKTRIQPELYGLSIDGHLGVIFSPRGLACGWELAQCPYCCGIHSKDALALGINVLAASLLQ